MILFSDIINWTDEETRTLFDVPNISNTYVYTYIVADCIISKCITSNSIKCPKAFILLH